MISKGNRPEDAAPSCGARPKRSPADKPPPIRKTRRVLSPEETRRTLHELRVHQIELEMQNEELRRAQAELDAARARYFDLYDLAPVGYCTLCEKGLILEANLTAATLLGVARGALVKQPITRFILEEDQDIYYLHRKQLFETGEPQACELRMVKKDGAPFWAHLAATVAQDADGASVCRVVLSDITARKSEEDARALTARLIAPVTAQSSFRGSHADLTASCRVGRAAKRSASACGTGTTIRITRPGVSRPRLCEGKPSLRLRPRTARSCSTPQATPCWSACAATSCAGGSIPPSRSSRPGQFLVQQHHRSARQHHRRRPPGPHAQPVQWRGV